MPPPGFFEQTDLDRIADAVKEAEERSGTEIVPVFARQSSFYEFVFWRLGFIASVLVSIVLLLLHTLSESILWWPAGLWLLVVLVGGLMGALSLLAFPALKRLFIGNMILERRVWEKAQLQFFKYGLSETPERNAILVFVSQFERRFVVLGDTGIAELVDQSVWDQLVNEYIDILRSSGPVEAICKVIAHCGSVIEESGYGSHETGRRDKDNLLGNHLREEGP